MKKLKKNLIIVMLICVTHSIKADVLSNGGGNASSLNYKITACIGETIIGLANSAYSSTINGFLAGSILAQSQCSTDFNNDSQVNLQDYAIFCQHWMEVCVAPYGCNCADISGDGIVNMTDLQMFIEDWLTTKYYTKFIDFALDQNPGWLTQGQWAFGQPSGSGGTHGNPDPLSGYTGSNIYGVNLAGDYSKVVGGPYYLTTGSIDCRGYYYIILKFARWLNTDIPEFTSSTIEVSIDGLSWSTIWEHTGTSPITDSTWQLMEYDISSMAHNQESVYIRWGYEIKDSHAYPYSGWNIDDIELSGNPM